jgi:hypothetical protein
MKPSQSALDDVLGNDGVDIIAAPASRGSSGSCAEDGGGEDVAVPIDVSAQRLGI